MTFTITKPDSGPSPTLDAPTIQGNFAQFGTIFARNHTALNLNNQGDHKAVIFEKQVSAPGVTEDLTVLFAGDGTSNVSTEPQLFFQIPQFLPNEYDTTKAPNVSLPLTYNAVNTAGPQYQSFLPGFYLLFFGSTANIAANIVLSPAPTRILCVIATPNNMTTAGTPIPYDVSVNIISNSTFKINSNLNFGGPVVPYSFGWVAIAIA